MNIGRQTSAWSGARRALLGLSLIVGLGSCALIAVHHSMTSASKHFEAARVEVAAGSWATADEELGEVERIFSAAAVVGFKSKEDYVGFHETMMAELHRLRVSLQAGGGADSVELFEQATQACTDCHEVYD